MEFPSRCSIHGHSDKGKMKQKPSQSPDCKEHKPLEPYMLFVMANYHVKPPYLLPVPVKISRLLPEATVPVVLNCRNRNWMTSYKGEEVNSNKRFDVTGWRIFVTDNKLKEGDGCYFELMEWSIKLIKFNVHILDGDLTPDELFMKCDTGSTSDAPINIE